MRRELILTTLCVLLAAPLLAASRRELSDEMELGSSDKVVVDFEVGELRIVGTDEPRVEVELDLRCKSSSASCERRLEDVEIVLDRRGTKLLVGFEGMSRKISNTIEVEGLVRMPARVELAVDMGIGELEIEGLESDIFVDMSIGRAALSLPERAVRSVYLDTGIGESQVWGSEGTVSASRPFLIGSEVEWESGPGRAEIVVDLGIGEVSVKLE